MYTHARCKRQRLRSSRRRRLASALSRLAFPTTGECPWSSGQMLYAPASGCPTDAAGAASAAAARQSHLRISMTSSRRAGIHRCARGKHRDESNFVPHPPIDMLCCSSYMKDNWFCLYRNWCGSCLAHWFAGGCIALGLYISGLCIFVPLVGLIRCDWICQVNWGKKHA